MSPLTATLVVAGLAFLVSRWSQHRFDQEIERLSNEAEIIAAIRKPTLLSLAVIVICIAMFFALGRGRTALLAAAPLLIVNTLGTAAWCSRRASVLGAPVRWLWVRALAATVMFATAAAYLLYR